MYAGKLVVEPVMEFTPGHTFRHMVTRHRGDFTRSKSYTVKVRVDLS